MKSNNTTNKAFGVPSKGALIFAVAGTFQIISTGKDDIVGLRGDCLFASWSPVSASRGVVVLIHGITLASYVWTDACISFSSAGFSVLFYDLAGRGRSSVSETNIPMNVHFFVEQLSALLKAVNLGEAFGIPVTLCGASLGGAIAAAFACAHPASVSRLCLIAPTGLSTSLPLMVRTIRAVPMIRRALACTCACLVRAKISSMFTGSRWEDEIHRDLLDPGFVSAYISTLANFEFSALCDTYSELGRTGKNRPTLILWGELDTVVAFTESRALLRHVPHASFHAVPNRGHSLATGEGDTSTVTSAIREFLLQ